MILVGQLMGNAFPEGVEMAYEFGQGAGGAHGRGVGTGGFEQAKYLKLLGVVQSLGVAHYRLPLAWLGGMIDQATGWRNPPGYSAGLPGRVD